MVAALVGLRETLVGAAQPPEDRAVATDRLNAIAGFEFKQSLPVIKDSDFDFERHVREFQSILDCHTFGRRGIRPYDQLTVFRKTLPAGSVRLKVYDTAVKRARKAGKLPHDAKDVYEDIITKLRTVIKETPMQRQERVEREFHELHMGRLPHATFRTEWEHLLDEMEDAGVDMPTENTLFRRYLSKITPEFRSIVLSRTYSLDGDDKPPRKPRKWEEVAGCIEIELDSRADARAPSDSIHSFGPPSGHKPGVTCGHCQRHDHFTEYCPKVAAERRNESAKCLADHARSGRICSICGQGDHNEEHHRLAIADFINRMHD